MSVWKFFDYVEIGGRNPIREWLDGLPEGDCEKIDIRLRHMAVMASWSEKWVSKYRGTDEIYELRISGNRVQYRPLGTYYGSRRFIILAGAIEKGKIPKSDVATSQRRLSNLRRNSDHAQPHQYDDENLEEDEE